MNNKILKKINIDYILKNYFYLIILLLIPLILITGFLYLVIPNYENMKLEIDTAMQLENQYSELKMRHIKKLKDYSKNFNLIEGNYLDKIKKILPYNKDISVIINEINQISKKVGVEMETINFKEDKIIGTSPNQNSDNELKKINFSVNIKNGKDYETFKKFIEEIESNIRLFDITSFYVTSNFEKYTFSITCYYKEI